MTPPDVLTTSDLWTLGIAAYAAVVSTFVLGWDAYKWLVSGPKIELYAQTGMQIIGGPEPADKSFVTVIASNVGDRPTTITNLGGMYFTSWWAAYVRRRKPTRAFVITTRPQFGIKADPVYHGRRMAVRSARMRFLPARDRLTRASTAIVSMAMTSSWLAIEVAATLI